MSKVIIDADELDRFASHLSRFNSHLISETSTLRGQFIRLGETWRDPQFLKFEQEFIKTMKNLERFQRISEEVIPKLKKTAARARDVHR